MLRTTVGSFDGNKFRRLRNERGLTTKETGRLIGRSDALVSLLETGKKQPSIKTLTAIASAFHLPVDDFIVKENERSDTNAERERGI